MEQEQSNLLEVDDPKKAETPTRRHRLLALFSGVIVGALALFIVLSFLLFASQGANVQYLAFKLDTEKVPDEPFNYIYYADMAEYGVLFPTTIVTKCDIRISVCPDLQRRILRDMCSFENVTSFVLANNHRHYQCSSFMNRPLPLIYSDVGWDIGLSIGIGIGTLFLFYLVYMALLCVNNTPEGFKMVRGHPLVRFLAVAVFVVQLCYIVHKVAWWLDWSSVPYEVVEVVAN